MAGELPVDLAVDLVVEETETGFLERIEVAPILPESQIRGPCLRPVVPRWSSQDSVDTQWPLFLSRLELLGAEAVQCLGRPLNETSILKPTNQRIVAANAWSGPELPTR
jgi:hypothetical protein